MVETLAWVTLAFALLTTVAFLCNFLVFRIARPVDANDQDWPAVSVLIPARDEAARISRTLQTVLANRGVQLEVVVLDDQSQDATAEVVATIANEDPRVRMISGQPLPRGWCGKQFACHQLAEHARHDQLLFIDADVRLADQAIVRCLLQRRRAAAKLLSGFPRQRLGSFGEALLLPLMHVILLSYLPFFLMRWTLWPAASAGCGQLFLTDRQSYEQAGGHAAIRSSLHDGLTLPRAYRRAGLSTDVFDASDLADCRMYRGWQESWSGLLKNAHEGIANGRLILPATSLMVMGYVAPTVLLVWLGLESAPASTLAVASMATAISFVPRVLSALRFDRAWLSVPMFPLSMILFVVLQWAAWVRQLSGKQATWRGRVYETA